MKYIRVKGNLNTHVHTDIQGQDPETKQLLLKQQVALDLRRKLNEYPDEKKGLKAISALMGVHEKTLKRLIRGENRPHYQTIFKIYRVIFNTDDDAHLIQLVPGIIQDFLEENTPNKLEHGLNYPVDLEKELVKNPIFCEIYLLALVESVTREFISFQYGQYGERVLTKMIEDKVLIPISANTFIVGKNRVNPSPETLKKVGLHLIDQFFAPTDSKAENRQSLYLSSLSEEAYNEWLKIDEEAFLKKIKIAKDKSNNGPVKAFTYSAVDTLNPSKKYLN